MSEQRIKLLGVFVYFSLNVSSGWMFNANGWALILLNIFILLLSLLSQWEASHWVHRIARKKYPQMLSLQRRILTEFIFVTLAALGIQVITDILLNIVAGDEILGFGSSRVLTLLLQSFAFSVTSVGLFEAYFHYACLRESEMEKEELKRLNLKSRLDNLKSHVNPHFLFNSLNTLSSLIQKDADRAEQFVQELSNVYRFLLKTNERQQISVSEELEFMKSYSHLLVTRFGENLHIIVNVEERYLDNHIPPLTLQLLTENAVKHNIISKERPLTINIFTRNGKLFVVNTLQRKSRPVLSDKTGLANIISKYKLLKNENVEIDESAGEFRVILPLQNVDRYESIDS